MILFPQQFSLFITLSWEQYYGALERGAIYENKKFELSNSITINANNTYVSNCYFHRMRSNTNGGAIVYSKKGSNILIEKCSFINCSALNFQGALRIAGGNYILAFSCGQFCFAEGRDGFCSVCDDNSRTINSVYDSSISNCRAQSNQIVYQEFGSILLKSLNSSNNKAKQGSSCSGYSSQFFQNTDLGCDFSYCSFCNNTAEEYFCVCLQSTKSNTKYQIRDSNIIHNDSKETILSGGETTLIHCSILNNSDPYFFIDDESSKIILVMCYEDKPDSEFSFVSTNGNQISIQFIHSLPFYGTGKCGINLKQCTEKSYLENLLISKIIIPSPFIFLLLSKQDRGLQ